MIRFCFFKTLKISICWPQILGLKLEETELKYEETDQFLSFWKKEETDLKIKYEETDLKFEETDQQNEIIKFLKKAETDQKYEETDQKFEETDQKYEEMDQF